MTTSPLFYIIKYQVLTTIVSTVTYCRAPLFEGYEFRKCAEKEVRGNYFHKSTLVMVVDRYYCTGHYRLQLSAL